MHEFALNDYVCWYEGEERFFGVIVLMNKKTAVVSDVYGYDEVELPYSRLTYLEPVVIGGEDYRRLVRLEGDVLERLRDNVPQNNVNKDGYCITVEDILAALKRIRGGEVAESDCDLWVGAIGVALRDRTDGKQADPFYNEDIALIDIYFSVRSPYDGGFTWEKLDEAITECELFLENKDLPISERKYPVHIMEGLLAELEKDVAMESASEEKVFLYRRFAEELAALDDPIGLKALGYSAYGGNRAFPCDWVRSRDAITRLFEIETEMPERAFYANTLGYIYYYGRCDGTPDYEKAYKYFSFAAFNGIYEARYKVADMYEKGLGVVTSVETSDSIVRDLYSENIEYIREGEFNCKLADVALRMGNIAAREGREDRSPEAAHYYYMQALFAIRRRMECMNYYGDGRVLAAIEGALSKTRDELGFKASRSVDLWSLESVLFSELTGGGRLDLVIKRQGACKYKLTFTPHKAREGRNGKRMFITIPALDFSGMLDKLTVTYKTDGEIAEELIGERIVIDDVDGGALISDGRQVLSYGEYRIKASDVFSGKVYRFAAVKLPFSDDTVDYIVLDSAVAVGDKVAVSRFGETHEGVVMALSEKRAHEVSLPIKFYKKVLGRAES